MLKCCSFIPKGLERHFKKVRARFYVFKGVDDPNLKRAYLNQLLNPFGSETLKYLEFLDKSFAQISLRDLYQLALRHLQRLCNKSMFLQNVEKLRKTLGKTCDRPNLQIKCSNKDVYYDYSFKKKKHHRRYHPNHRHH